jgi:hypothetical protein
VIVGTSSTPDLVDLILLRLSPFLPSAAAARRSPPAPPLNRRSPRRDSLHQLSRDALRALLPACRPRPRGTGAPDDATNRCSSAGVDGPLLPDRGPPRSPPSPSKGSPTSVSPASSSPSLLLCYALLTPSPHPCDSFDSEQVATRTNQTSSLSPLPISNSTPRQQVLFSPLLLLLLLLTMPLD